MASLQLLLREAAVRYRPWSVEVNRICSRCIRKHIAISKSTCLSTNCSRTKLRHGAFLSSGTKLVLTVQEGLYQIDKMTYCGQKLDKDSEELLMLKQKFVKEKSKLNSSTEGFLSEIERSEFLANLSENVLPDNDNEDLVKGRDNVESNIDLGKLKELTNKKSLCLNRTSDTESKLKDFHIRNEMGVTGTGVANKMATSQDPDSDTSDSEGLLTDVESESESSSSDDDSSDLVSDESSDEESKFTSLGENEAFSDVEEMKKEGLTSEEMVELIEQFGDLENFSQNEVDGDPDDTIENVPKDNYDLQNTDAGFSSPSRHFDESGVISLVGHDMDKVKLSSEDWSVEEIEDFVNIATEEVEETDWQPPVSLQRGVEGVFDIQELVELLRVENIQDLVTIRIPPEKNFGDYMVIGTAKSFRHLSAVSENINWIYKQRKFEAERYLKQEGKKEKSGWIAVDLGNIILHLFLPDQREVYDLETLWTVGSKYDWQSLEEEDPYALSVEDHPWLKELEELKSGRIDKR